MHFLKFLLPIFIVSLAVLLWYNKSIFASWTLNIATPNCQIAFNTSGDSVTVTVTSTASDLSSIELTQEGATPISRTTAPISPLTHIINPFTGSRSFSATVVNTSGNKTTCSNTYYYSWLKTINGDVHSNR